jgi:hypothetical protein
VAPATSSAHRLPPHPPRPASSRHLRDSPCITATYQCLVLEAPQRRHRQLVAILCGFSWSPSILSQVQKGFKASISATVPRPQLKVSQFARFETSNYGPQRPARVPDGWSEPWTRFLEAKTTKLRGVAHADCVEVASYPYLRGQGPPESSESLPAMSTSSETPPDTIMVSDPGADRLADGDHIERTQAQAPGMHDLQEAEAEVRRHQT